MVGGVFSAMRTVVRNNPKMIAGAGLVGLGAAAVSSNPNQKSNHTVAKTVIGAATFAAGLALGNKYGVFTKAATKLAEFATKHGASGVLQKGVQYAGKALGHLDGAGAKVLGYTGKALNAVKNTKIGGQIVEKGGKFVNETVVPFAKKGIDFVKNLAKGVANNAGNIA